MLNFYVDEKKLRRLLWNPARFAPSWEGVWGYKLARLLNLGRVATAIPATATWLNRAIGHCFR